MSGIAASVSLAKETAYGTYVAPNRPFEFDSEGFERNPTHLVSNGLRRGRRFQSAARHVETSRSPSGSLVCDFPYKGGGSLLDLLHGNVVTPVQQATSIAYKQTHPLGTTDAAKSATVQVNRPDVANADHAFSYLGGVIESWTLANDVNGLLKFTSGWQFKDEITSEALVIPAYPADNGIFHFQQADISIAGASSSASGFVLPSFSMAGTLGRKTDRMGLGTGGTRLKPVENAYSGIEIALGSEFQAMTNQGYFTDGTVIAVVATWTGPVIASTFRYELKATMPACKVTGASPNVSGPDVLDQPLSILVLSNGTDAACTVELTEVATTV